uniref:hypothetical protein n=1 Tax=Psychrobacter sp. TaxID=56811 RepID=UPI001599AD8B|nr:hypothetical protein [Psychrobacter sp.]QJS05521.1 restriction nuclease [Psychrobacter sp.]
MPRYNEFESHLVQLFNASKNLSWRNKNYSEIFACKPATQGSGGECKTDIYVSLRNMGKEEDCIKITVKKADADFLVNKMTASDAEGLLGSNWSAILTESMKPIEQQFRTSKIIYISPKDDPKDMYFTLGWKLEITNKKRKLSSELKLSSNDIVNKVYRGTEQPERRKDALVDNVVIENSGIADYLLEGNSIDFSDTQSVLDKLIDLSSYTPPPVYLVFTANNYRVMANKADGKRTLAVAIEWSLSNGKLVPEFILESPLKYQGETHMMPSIKSALAQIGITTATMNTELLKELDIDSLQ